jgi:hypothetical protein
MVRLSSAPPEKASNATPIVVASECQRFAHSVNNRLTLPYGVLDQLQASPDIPADYRAQIATALTALEHLMAETRQFQRRLHRAEQH